MLNKLDREIRKFEEQSLKTEIPRDELLSMPEDAL